MFMGILLGVSLAILGMLLAAAIVFWDVAFCGEGEHSPWRRLWRQPLATAQALGERTAKTAQGVVRSRLKFRCNRQTSKAMVTELLTGASEAIEASPQRARSDCDAQCKTRRFARIGLTAPEALQLAEYLQENHPAVQVRAILQRAAQNAAQALPDHGGAERASVKICPLLTADETCAAYPVRPLACRGWCPMCAKATDATAEIVTAPQLVPLDGLAYAIGSGAKQGLAHGLAEAGMDGSVYELNSALAVALDTPRATEKWLRGEPVFADCVPAT